MAKDKFKSVAATFQIFKDGEAVSARKLDGIIRKTQDGSDKIQQSLGDMGNFGLAFSGLPLFHNSISRAIGPADAVTIAPIRVFETPQELSSRDRGQVRFPYSTAAAPDAGNRSQNLLPTITQVDKIGVGCTADDGSKCLNRFDTIYDEEKNILPNGLFDLQLSGWQTSGVLFDGQDAILDTVHRFNSLGFSEDFTQWTNISGTVTDRAFDDPNNSTNATAYQAAADGTSLVSLELAGDELEQGSNDWCFSVYMATSGQSTTVFLEIDQSTHLRSTQGRGGINPEQTVYAVDISGTGWNRYYVYGTFVDTRTSGVARIHLSRGNVANAKDQIYIWGAQLEPTFSPSEYQPTSGLAISGRLNETFIGQNFDVIPAKWYQVSIDWTLISGATWSLVQDGLTLISPTSSKSATQTFKASTANVENIVGFRDSNIYIYVSGNIDSTMKLNSFRVDPGTPCHALNCPGFSAYEKNRRYRATLPTITDANAQYFGDQLQFPDGVNVAEVPKLPTNILGVFDHEQNRSVPTTLVDWRLAHWPIGNNIQAGFINDPEFLTAWTTGPNNTYPTELSPTDLSISGLSRNSILSFDFIPTAFIPIDPSTLSPVQWFEADDLTDGEGDQMTGPTPNKGSLGGNLDADVGGGGGDGLPIVRLNALNGFKAVETNGDMFIQWDNFLDIDREQDYTAIVVYKTFDDTNLTCQLGANRSHSGAGSVEGLEFPRNQAAVAVMKAHYGNAVGNTVEASIQFSNQAADTLTSGLYHITIVRGENANPLAGRHYTFHDGVDISVDPPNVRFGARFNLILENIFCLGFDAESTSGTQLVEVLIYDNLLTDPQVEGAWQFLANKFFSESQLLDELKISVASGVQQGVNKTFALEKNEVATWVYNVRGDTGISGVIETYTSISGTVEIDTDLDGVYSELTSGTSTTNIYQVTTTLPGETSFSSQQNGWYQITRRVRALTSNAFITLGIELRGDDSTAPQEILIDSFDLLKQNSTSSKFEYCGEPVLGLNFAGRATHVRAENLFQFSSRLLLWESSGLSPVIDTDASNKIRLVDVSGTIFQSIPGADLLDDTFTLTWSSQASIATSGDVRITQGTVAQTFDWDIPTQPTSGIILFSGIDYETGSDLEVRWTIFGEEAILSNPQLIHGSGTVTYVSTSSERIKKYRRVIQPVSLRLDTSWAPAYALIQGGILQTNHSGTIDSTGTSWPADDTRGFPDQGVIRIAGQEYGYHEKISGFFLDTIVGWRGTTFNPSIIASGSRITNVSIPQSITKIDPVTQEITFRDIIPVPIGDWANSLNLEIYNTHVGNLDRFSLQASAVPVTQATGNLLTAFVQHVGDHRRHFRLSQLCGQIIDSSSWCASPVIRALADVVDGTIEEISEQAQLNVEAKRFVPASNKHITISWGDGAETTVSGVGNRFPGNTHIYDLRHIAQPQSYTIQVVIKDLDLDFSRRVSTTIIVRPKVNSAGESTKSTFQATSKILLPGNGSMTATAKIKARNESTTTASADMVIP